MRVLVSSTAGSGHFGPLVPFARAAAAAGHEVTVATPASFAADVAATGLQHRPFADPAPDLMGRAFGRISAMTLEDADAMVVREVFGRLDAQAALPGLLDVMADWTPDLVLRDPAEYGSLAAAARLGVPQAMIAHGVSATMAYVAPLVEEPLSDLDAIAGLPVGTGSAIQRTAKVLTCAPAVLDGPDPDRSPDTTRLHRFRDDSLAADPGRLPEPWGDPSHPLVYVTFGSLTARLDGFGDLYPAAVSAFADEPVRVLLTTGREYDPANLPPVPDNVRVERWWPQSEVMPHAAAVVGHGGFGTTMAALAAGVPQVLVPLFSHDQHINAAHVEAVGAGVTLRGGAQSLGGLPGAVGRVLDGPSHRRAARAVAEEMAGLPPVDDAVRLMEAIAAGR